MFEKEAEEWVKENMDCCETDNFVNQSIPYFSAEERCIAKSAFKDGAEFGYNKANEQHSPDEHIDKDRIVLGIIKHCNKIRYSLVLWNGEWWYQYGSYNAEVRLIAWYNIPELKESK